MLKNPVFWIVIVGLVLLLFGASRLPDIAGNVGKSLKVFKKEIKELQDDTDMSDAKTVLQEDQPNQAQSTTANQTTSDQQAPQPTPEQRSNDTSTT